MIRITDTNNPLERCSIKIVEYGNTHFDGIVSFKVNEAGVDAWILYDSLNADLIKNLCSFLAEGRFLRLFTMQVETFQGNYLTCFSTCTISPIDTLPSVPNGLIMFHSDNWIENWKVEGIEDPFITDAELFFPYTEFWFSHSVQKKPATITINRGDTLRFEIREWDTFKRFELREEKTHQAVIEISFSKLHSIRELCDFHEFLLFLLRFSTGIWLSPAKIIIRDKKEAREIKSRLQYIFPLSGLEKSPNSNAYMKEEIPLQYLLDNPNCIEKWMEFSFSNRHSMRLLADIFYSEQIEITERLLKLIQVFDHLSKKFFDNSEKKKKDLGSRLQDSFCSLGICISDLTNQSVNSICKEIADYRNTESHGDSFNQVLDYSLLERIMHRLMVPFVKKYILGMTEI